METKHTKFPTPPWDMEIAAERLVFEENAWNSHEPDKILEGYADNIEMRDGVDFINGKQELVQFLTRKFDASGQWYRNYGVQVFQFNDHGYAERRFASQETISIVF